MAAGLQVFDEQGVCIFDTSHRIGKILGSMTVSKDGSIYVSLPQGNQLFFIITAINGNFGELKPTFSVDGGNLSWVYASRTKIGGGVVTVKSSCTFIYGIF